jgi:hypothetical protein
MRCKDIYLLTLLHISFLFVSAAHVNYNATLI